MLNFTTIKLPANRNVVFFYLVRNCNKTFEGNKNLDNKKNKYVD